MHEIAEAMGVGLRTIFDHLDDPEFRQAMNEARDLGIERLGKSAMSALQKHIEDWSSGAEITVTKTGPKGDEIITKPVELSPPLVQAALRAMDVRFAQSHRQLEHSGKVDFGQAMDGVAAKRDADRS